ncbi:adenylate kinase family protein [Aspergillus alliaceus]|uniref:adenylate kinase family protein n=1 Tax=Petromyces alliaceus TaxID=209559 RepID=UPI0012A768CB|nr:P-loop containing nucleoside triphosphate hydrolase protein [Aspergillus alliaceus]KAB8234693.1 P-loop containing nucleoside triphosphate hydrolase protein [Aspergillus alliaceus]
MPDVPDDPAEKKKSIVQRVCLTLPFSGLWQDYSRAHVKSACRQGVAAAVTRELKTMPEPEVHLSMATVIFLIGGPGAGKSTIATKLAADLGLIHLDPDKIVRRLEITGPEEIWLAVKGTMDENGTIPDDVLSLLLKFEVSKHLEAPKCVFLIEAFPRSYAQFVEFISICGYGLTISLDVSSATLMRRFITETESFSERVARMEDFLKREDAFAVAELALHLHPSFTEGLIKVCAELKVEEYYPHLKGLVERKLASPKMVLWTKELGMEMVSPAENIEL